MSSTEYINSVVLTASAANVTFSNIPQNYQDLKIIYSGTVNANSYNPAIRFNSDSTSTYSTTRLIGNGSSASSDRTSNLTFIIGSAGTITNQAGFVEIDILSYGSTNIFKTVLISNSHPGVAISCNVGLWRSTSAITSISLNADVLGSAGITTGSNATLLGVK